MYEVFILPLFAVLVALGLFLLFARLIGWGLGISEVRKAAEENSRLLADVIKEIRAKHEEE